MKTSKILMSCAIVFIGFTSCGKDDNGNVLNGECFGGTWIQEISNEATAWATAGTEYSENATFANCQKYYSAGIDYLDALDRIKECVPATSLSDFDKSIEEAKEELAANNCVER